MLTCLRQHGHEALVKYILVLLVLLEPGLQLEHASCPMPWMLRAPPWMLRAPPWMLIAIALARRLGEEVVVVMYILIILIILIL